MKKKKQVKRYSIPKMLISALLAFLMFGIVIESYVQLNDMYNKVSDAEDLLTEYKSENVRLESKLEAQASVKNIEEYAEEVLGMEKLNSSQIKYIQIQEDDVVYLPETEENIFVKIKLRFNEFIEYLKG
jgi:hypothetical protein